MGPGLTPTSAHFNVVFDGSAPRLNNPTATPFDSSFF
jgi:hypothetical protein